jgi:hypothetical protein
MTAYSVFVNGRQNMAEVTRSNEKKMKRRDGEIKTKTDMRTREVHPAQRKNLYPMLVMETLSQKHNRIVETLGLAWHAAHAHEVLSRRARARVTQDALVHGLSLLHTKRRGHHAHPHLHGEHMRR